VDEKDAHQPLEQVPNSGHVTAVMVLSNGTIVGVGLDYKLWTRATLNSGWQLVENTQTVIDCTELADGEGSMIVGLGKDNLLWTRRKLDQPWDAVPNSGRMRAIASM
jgi:hypothetical protein